MITAEQLYNYYHKMTFFHEKGIYPRAVVDFTNAKSKDYWKDFEKAVELVNSNPNIDYRTLVDSLASTFKNRFDPVLLHHPKGMKIYNGYVKIRNMGESVTDVENIVKTDMMNVSLEIIQYEINSLDEYLNYNRDIIPLAAIHYGNGLTSSFFMATIPDILDILDGYSQDIKEEYFMGFIENYDITRDKILKTESLRKISDNFYKIMDSVIKKTQETVKLEITNNNNSPNKGKEQSDGCKTDV